MKSPNAAMPSTPPGESNSIEGSEKQIAEMRRKAGVVLQKHFSAHPEGVMIVSFSQGRIQCDVTDFPNGVGTMLIAKEALLRSLDESFDKALMGWKGAEEEKAPTPDQVQ